MTRRAPRSRRRDPSRFGRRGVGRRHAAFTQPLPEGTTVQIRYATATKSTTLSVSGGGTATVAGLEFMHATWSIWFAKIDQSDLGDALIRRIPANPASG